MEQQYWDQMPLAAQAIIREVEALSPVPITQMTDQDYQDFGKMASRPVLDMDRNGARIVLPTLDTPAHLIFHEFLHLKRYWIDGIPKLAHIIHGGHRV